MSHLVRGYRLMTLWGVDPTPTPLLVGHYDTDKLAFKGHLVRRDGLIALGRVDPTPTND